MPAGHQVTTYFWQDIRPGGESVPSAVVSLIPRLVGNATTPYTLTITFNEILEPGGTPIAPGPPEILTFRRGDVQGDGDIDVFDRMFGSQYLAELRTIGEINPVNMASVRHDGDSGDKMSVFDSMFISQYLAELRDAYYN